MHEKMDLINTDAKQENYKEFSYYKPKEKQLISKIQSIDWTAILSFPIPENFDWNKIPFRRDCSIEELSLIEQGLNSEDLEQRLQALGKFIDFKTWISSQVIELEKEMIEKMAGFFNPNISPSFQESLKDTIQQACCQAYLNYIQNKDNFESISNGRILVKKEKEGK